MRRGRPPKHSTAPSSDFVELLELWQRAANSPKGIRVPHSNPNRLLQRLYAVRRETGGFQHLKLVETDEAVLIVHTGI